MVLVIIVNGANALIFTRVDCSTVAPMPGVVWTFETRGRNKTQMEELTCQ